MQKSFCDCCGTEINTVNALYSETGNIRFRHISPTDKHPSFSITIGRRSLWNTGDWCKYCIIDAINKHDDRPRAS